MGRTGPGWRSDHYSKQLGLKSARAHRGITKLLPWNCHLNNSTSSTKGRTSFLFRMALGGARSLHFQVTGMRGQVGPAGVSCWNIPKQVAPDTRCYQLCLEQIGQ